jgi:hypothetical protein
MADEATRSQIRNFTAEVAFIEFIAFSANDFQFIVGA